MPADFTDQYTPVELTAYCGLFCGDCLRLGGQAGYLARGLAAELDRTGWDRYARAKAQADPEQVAGAAEFAAWPQFRRVLAAISQQECTRPCRLGGDGCQGQCRIKACNRQRGQEGCWQCRDCEACDKLRFLLPLHGQNLWANLRLIQDKGLKHWAPWRQGFYAWS